MSDENTITIPIEEYRDLSERAEKYDCVRAAGVDNWDGWEYAMEMYNGDDE